MKKFFLVKIIFLSAIDHGRNHFPCMVYVTLKVFLISKMFLNKKLFFLIKIICLIKNNFFYKIFF